MKPRALLWLLCHAATVFCESMTESCDPTGQWSEWLPWVECVAGETQVRERGCLAKEGQHPECGDLPVICPGEDMEYRECREDDGFPEGALTFDQGMTSTRELELFSPQPCQYEGTWSEWGSWEPWPLTINVRRRLRSCLGVPPECRPLVGFNCTFGSYIETDTGNGVTGTTPEGETETRASPHLPPTTTTIFYDPNCVASPWTEWTAWNTCTASCGNCGWHQRTRHKLGTLPNGENCPIPEYFEWEKTFCNPVACIDNSTHTCCRNHVLQSKGADFVCVPPP
uniref:ShKT domain-containing protein n=1 Tax=Steinernema glaseri TaxID=37863 RepID=A0A1I7ZCK3_9BILA